MKSTSTLILLVLLPAVLGITYTPGTDTCKERCLDHYDLYNMCQCTENCAIFGDCCLDFYVYCIEPEVPIDSCEGQCGRFDPSKPCQCNDGCVSYGDCCDDYILHCGDDASCTGRCDLGYQPDKQCQCNDLCEQYNNCCDDYLAICTGQEYSCVGKCFSDYDSNLECQCNTECATYGNCCSDYEAECFLNTSCKGRCSVEVDSSFFCECVDECDVTGSCCTDYVLECIGTCDGRCDDEYDGDKPCQCNDNCMSKGDCCVDYNDICNNGTGPDPITNDDIATLAEELWANDVNRLGYYDYVINKQTLISDENVHQDVSNDPFYTSVNESALTGPTFTTFAALLDNYNPQTRVEEVYTLQELQEIEDFLDAVFESTVMSLTAQLFINKGWYNTADEFREWVKEVWFGNYSRKLGDPFDSSGFEHVFVGEFKSGVSGFHNWLQFYYEEKAGRLEYYGYLNENTPNQIALQFNWQENIKEYGSTMYGASPEFELAMLSTCFRVKPGSQCTFTLGGALTKIQTYVIRDMYIGSAYFIV